MIGEFRAVPVGLLVVALLLAAGCRRPASAERRARPEAPTAGEESANGTDQSPSRSATPGSGGSETTPETPRRPHRLAAFFRALHRADREDTPGVARILQVGDSHTASDTITGRLRELFQKKFGNAGRGYAYPGVPWESFRQEQMEYAASPEWKTSFGTARDAQPPYAAGGLRVETSQKDAWLERRSCGLVPEDEKGSDDPDPPDCPFGETFDRFAIFYLVQPDGGSFTVEVDDTNPTVIETDGDEYDLGVYRRGVDPGRHTVRLETRGDGRVSLLGIRTRSGDDGIEFSSLGINGATGPEFASFDRDLTHGEIRALDPDLMIFAFGTNGAYNLHRMHNEPDIPTRRIVSRLTSYQFEFGRLLERYRAAAPQASCLVVLPPDVAPKREDAGCRRKKKVRDEKVCLPPTIRYYAGVVAAQKAAARRYGCAVWNQSRAMGGAGSIQYWAALEPPLAREDGIHLTMDGYHLLAEGLFGDLMRSYAGWKDGDTAPLRTRLIEPPSRPKASRSNAELR